MNKKEELLKFCRYYHGEKEPKSTNDAIKKTLWSIERMWVELMMREDESFIANALNDYIELGLNNFNETDDTPVTLKAVLLNRFIQYTERIDVDAFKKFYQKYY